MNLHGLLKRKIHEDNEEVDEFEIKESAIGLSNNEYKEEELSDHVAENEEAQMEDKALDNIFSCKKCSLRHPFKFTFQRRNGK